MRSPKIVPSLLAASLLAALVLVVVLSRRVTTVELAYDDLFERALYLDPGNYVPEFSGETLAGDPVHIGSPEAGRRQLLFFFTTACLYSQASIPAWKRIASQAGERFEVYGISLDSVRLTRPYVAEHALPYPVMTLLDRRTVELYRVRRVPLVLVIDSGGRVAHARRGAMEPGAAVDSVLRALRLENESIVGRIKYLPAVETSGKGDRQSSPARPWRSAGSPIDPPSVSEGG